MQVLTIACVCVCMYSRRNYDNYIVIIIIPTPVCLSEMVEVNYIICSYDRG